MSKLARDMSSDTVAASGQTERHPLTNRKGLRGQITKAHFAVRVVAEPLPRGLSCRGFAESQADAVQAMARARGIGTVIEDVPKM